MPDEKQSRPSFLRTLGDLRFKRYIPEKLPHGKYPGPLTVRMEAYFIDREGRKHLLDTSLGILQDPLLDAIESREMERDHASSQVVVQGSLAYLHSKYVRYPVERLIPVDIYSKEEAHLTLWKWLSVSTSCSVN
jgi:hypothetical protein